MFFSCQQPDASDMFENRSTSLFLFNAGHVIVSCLPPFSTDGLKLEDTECLLKKIHQDMSRVFHEMSLEDHSDNANFA